MTNILNLENVSKTYITKKVKTLAVLDVSFTLKKGDYLAITGKSGGGKSTLLNIIGLLDSPTKGTYKYLEYNTNTLNHKQLAQLRNKGIGYVFQSFSLIESLNIYDNIALPMIYNNQGKAEIKKRIHNLAAEFEIFHRLSHYPNELSGGQQQRVAIVRALANNPSLLVLDEPTGNLDSENSLNVMNIVEQLNIQGTTICLVTHDQEFASKARRLLVMSDGKLKEQA
ncbi:MAG: ABC transporter ATP-binding protein [Proteobacteria bacterium]|nr:ABC transporter ATP-binding protein [Pseudomonadota bacterium]